MIFLRQTRLANQQASWPHRLPVRLLLFLAGLMALYLLTGCEVLPFKPAADLGPTPVPTATLDPSGYQAIPPQGCLINNFATIQSERRMGGKTLWQQGSLIAFQPMGGGAQLAGVNGGTPDSESPGGAKTVVAAGASSAGQGTQNSDAPAVAYLAPAERTSWFSGDLMLARGPKFTDPQILAPGVLAAGDLTWSPNGEWLAFLAYRPNESLYTVMAVRADGSGRVDLFPQDAARTDSRNSPKAILGWKDNATVQVITSCGEECRNAFDIRVDAPAGPVLTPTPIDDYHTLSESLQPYRKTETAESGQFPRNMINSSWPITKSLPGWSPDGDLVTYLDSKGILWLLSISGKFNYPVDIGLRDVVETQWSSDSHWLGIRAEDRVFIYQIPCDKKP